MAARRSEIRSSRDPSPFSRVDDGPASPQERTSDSTSDSASPSAEQIATAAYYRAAARGFAPGRELEDWLEAERELRTGH